jgi:hypothetical protein
MRKPDRNKHQKPASYWSGQRLLVEKGDGANGDEGSASFGYRAFRVCSSSFWVQGDLDPLRYSIAADPFHLAA